MLFDVLRLYLDGAGVDDFMRVGEFLILGKKYCLVFVLFVIGRRTGFVDLVVDRLGWFYVVVKSYRGGRSLINFFCFHYRLWVFGLERIAH